MLLCDCRRRVLNVTEDHNINYLGEVRWELVLCLLLAWILVIIFVSRGIKSTGKVGIFELLKGKKLKIVKLDCNVGSKIF